MSYDIWDLASGNLIRTYASEREALAFVRAAVAHHGRRYVSRWALLTVAGDGDDEADHQTIAQGAVLAKLAGQSVPA